MQFKKILCTLLISSMVINSSLSAFAEPLDVVEDTVEEIVEDGTKPDDNEIIDDIVEEIVEEISDDGQVESSDDEEDEIKEDGNAESPSELSDEDIAKMCGYKELPSERYVESVVEHFDSEIEEVGASSLPASYITSNLPNTRNQNPYGTCWAHSSTALAEISLIKQGYITAEEVDNSELHLAYFTYNSPSDDPLGLTAGDVNKNIGKNFLDRGGNLTFSQNVFAGWVGSAAESTAPYSTARTVLSEGLNDAIAFDDVAHLRNYYEVSKEDREQIKELIMRNGAVGLSYYHKQDYYDSDNNSYYNYVDNETNHAVTVIGWDDNFPASKFRRTPAGDGAWRIRNSWTTNSGESIYGYFWLSYFDTSISNTFYSFEFEPASNYDNNYHYDGGFYTNTFYGTSERPLKAANVFTAKAYDDGEVLKAVSFYTSTVNTNYAVKVYKGVSGSNPESGTLVSSGTEGFTTFAGNYTVDLSEPVELRKGDVFSVVVELSKNDESTSIGYEYSSTGDWYKTVTSIAAGQSFINKNGEWSDFKDETYNGGNLRIKAFTKNKVEQGESVLPQSIKITGTIPENGLTLGIGAFYQGGARILPFSTSNRKVLWESSNPLVASVDSNGLVKGVSVGTATITAKSEAKPELADSFVVNVTDQLTDLMVKDITTVAAHPNGINRGAVVQCEFTTTPANAIYDSSKIVWESSEPRVATISKSGEITAVGVGTTNISVSIGGVKSANKVLTVYQEALLPNVISRPDGTLKMFWDGISGATEYYITVQGYKETIIKPNVEDKYEYIYEFPGDIPYNINLEVYLYSVVEAITGGQYSYGYGSKYMIGPVSNYMNVTYSANGGKIDGNDTWVTTVVKGGAYNYQPKAERTGYNFSHWYNSRYGVDKSITYNTIGGIHEDHTLYAKWNPIKYTFAYDGNDHTSGSMDTVTTPAQYDENVTLHDNLFEKEGYIFTGWNTQSDGSGRAFSENEVVKNVTTEDKKVITLYAQWEALPDPVTVTFDSQGGSFTNPESATKSVNPGLKYGKLPAVTKTGYSFDGWFTQANDGDEVTENTICTAESDHTIYAQWSPISYTVKYNANGGAGSMTDSPAKYGTAFALKANTFSKNGYSFAGWSTSSGQQDVVYEDSDNVNNLANVDGATFNLYAQWIPNTYYVQYSKNADDASGSLSRSTATYDTDLTLKSNTFTKTGYAFAGWNTMADGSGTEYADGASVSNLTSTQGGEVTLYAQWAPNAYTICFDGNGATDGSTASIAALYGKSYNLTANGFTRLGYTFNGWRTVPGNSGGDGRTFTDQQSVSNLQSEPGSTITLYAKWSANSYTIRFNPNADDASGEQTDIFTKYDKDVDLSHIGFDRPGYTFAGWSTAPGQQTVVYANQETVSNLSSVNNSYVDLYAQWTPITYFIQYYKNFVRATGTMTNSSVTYDENMTLKANAYSRTGYTFNGWNSAGDGSGTAYADGVSVKNLTTIEGYTYVLYAQWAPISYSIVYDKNADEATGSMANTVAVYDETATLRTNTFTRPGYTFAGWSTTSGQQSVIYSDAADVINLATTNGAAYTLYAQWSPISYSIAYDKNADDAMGSMANTAAVYDTATILRSNSYSREGYVFAGWNTKADGTGTDYTDAHSVMNLSNVASRVVTLYAKWRPYSYTIAFDGNGATGGTTISKIVDVGDTVSLTANGYIKKGYTFTGWSIAPGQQTVVYTDEAEVINLATTDGATYTLYAQWAPISYSIAYDKNVKSGHESEYSGSMANTAAVYDAATILRSNSYSREGYVFAGWNTKADGTGTDYTDAHSVMNLSNVASRVVTLYAKWEGLPHTLILDANGGLVDGLPEKSITKKTGEIYGALPYPVKDDHIFIGWYTTSENGIPVNSYTEMPNNDVTIYAYYRENINGGAGTPSDNLPADEDQSKEVKVLMTLGKKEQKTATVTFDFDGGNVVTTPYTSNGAKAKLMKPVKEGYTFIAWIANGKKVAAITDKMLSGGDITLKAVYAENVYTVNYKLTKPAAGAKFSSKIKAAKYKYTDIVTFPGGITATDKAGKTYKLKGWATSAGGPVVYSADDKDVSKLAGATKKNKKVVLYSVWE